MATKYTKPDSTEDAPLGSARTAGSHVRFRGFSTAPPSRKALTWIIIGTALIVTLLMITSELPVLDVKSTTGEYVWQHGTVIPNESTEGERVLRVEIPAEDDEPPKVYDISLEGHDNWATIPEGDAVRIQVLLGKEGNIKRIVRVEPDKESTEDKTAKE